MNLNDCVDEVANVAEALREFSKKYSSPTASDLGSRIGRLAEELKEFVESLSNARQTFLVGIQTRSKTSTDALEKTLIHNLWRLTKTDAIDVKLLKNDNIEKNRRNLTFEILTPLSVSRDMVLEAAISATRRSPQTETLGVAERLKQIA